MSWHLGPLASFDIESTGLDTSADRIVTAALITPSGRRITWLSDVDGIEIPEQATAVHGIPTEHARAHGRPAKEVVEEIADAVAGELSAGRAALVVMNAPYDLTLLDRECTRHGVATMTDRIGAGYPIIDPLVLDRAADKYRKGRRNLEALAAHYGVDLTDAHTADADAQAALEVAVRIGEKYPELQVDAGQLHAWQVTWHARWATGYEAHLRRLNPDVNVNGHWPIIPAAIPEPTQ